MARMVPDHDAERISGDEMPGRRDADAQVPGDIRQQPHDHELGGADGECGRGERKDGDGHPLGLVARFFDVHELVHSPPEVRVTKPGLGRGTIP
jgi:hypothetical protein